MKLNPPAPGIYRRIKDNAQMVVLGHSDDKTVTYVAKTQLNGHGPKWVVYTENFWNHYEREK